MGFKYNGEMLKKITEDAGYIYVNYERRKNGQLYVGFICPKHKGKGT